MLWREEAFEPLRTELVMSGLRGLALHALLLAALWLACIVCRGL